MERIILPSSICADASTVLEHEPEPEVELPLKDKARVNELKSRIFKKLDALVHAFPSVVVFQS